MDPLYEKPTFLMYKYWCLYLFSFEMGRHAYDIKPYYLFV
jgi:hypothetical protein